MFKIDDFELIQEYKNMKSISSICKDLNIDYSNIMKGKSTKEKEAMVAELIKLEIIRFYSAILMNNKRSGINE